MKTGQNKKIKALKKYFEKEPVVLLAFCSEVLQKDLQQRTRMLMLLFIERRGAR